MKLKRSDFERSLLTQKPTILDSIASLRSLGAGDKVRLGETLLIREKNLALYLYENAIHPNLFAEAISLIAARTDRLVSAQLCHLSRYHLADAFKRGEIDINRDLGESFDRFGLKPEEDKLMILENMGVVSLTPPPLELPPVRIPRFSLDEQLLGKATLTQFPETFFAFERTTIKATTLNERELIHTLEIFFEPENLSLAESTARTLREMGGTELHVKFHHTQEGIVAEFKAKGIGQFLDSASILLIPKGIQQILC